MKGIAIVALALAACNAKPTKVEVSPADRARAVCQALVDAKVATDCRDGGVKRPDLVGYQSYTFVPVGAFPKDQGVVSVFLTDDAFSHGDGTPPGTPADDYPNLVVRSAPTRTAIANTTTDASDDAWDTCRKSKAVAACAKAHPSEYAKLHTLYDAATKAAAAP